jgi:hypothetical protein
MKKLFLIISIAFLAMLARADGFVGGAGGVAGSDASKVPDNNGTAFGLTVNVGTFTNTLSNFPTNTPNTLFLDPLKGNDSTAIVGNPNKAWLTLTGVVANAYNGSTIIMLASTATNFITTNQLPQYPIGLTLPVGVKFHGVSEKQCIIATGGPGVNTEGWIILRDNDDVGDFTFYDNESDGSIVCIPIYLGGEVGSCTNTIISNIEGVGQSDFIFGSFEATPQVGFDVNVDVWNSKIVSHFDCFNMFGTNTSMVVNFHNCDLEPLQSAFSSNLRAITVLCGTVNAINCSIVYSNAITAPSNNGILHAGFNPWTSIGGNINFSGTITVLTNVNEYVAITKNATNNINFYGPIGNIPPSLIKQFAGSSINFNDSLPIVTGLHITAGITSVSKITQP